jgi:hypothetical protein
MSNLREKNIRLPNQASVTDDPIKIQRKEDSIEIVDENKKTKLANLKCRKVFNCNPEELVHMNWLSLIH